MTPKEYKQLLLDELKATYTNQMPCHLGFAHRKNVVFGEGNANARLMLIGEAPGQEEDIQGRPFVGRSGQLLRRALKAAGIDESEIYITNVLKCRPPDNRTPLPDEMELCANRFLYKQIKIVRPDVIMTLGSIALRVLTHEDHKITRIHGQPMPKNEFTIIPIYHPAYVLRNRTVAQDWLNDMKSAKDFIEKSSTQKNAISD